MRYIFIVVLLASTWVKAQEKSVDKIKQDSLVIDRERKTRLKSLFLLFKIIDIRNNLGSIKYLIRFLV